MDDLAFQHFKQRFDESVRVFTDHPALLIIVGIVIILLTVFKMDDTKSSAGSYIFIFIGIVFFMWGLGLATGMGIGLNF